MTAKLNPKPKSSNTSLLRTMDVQHMFFHEEVLIFYYDRIECS
jgi:hypothetical protein